MSADGGRFTSLAASTTSATSIDEEYNLKSDPLRLVTSDGVLFCIPKRFYCQSKVFSAITGGITLSEIQLTGPICDSDTLRALLRILHSDSAKIDAAGYMDVLLLASKFGFQGVVKICSRRLLKAFGNGDGDDTEDDEGDDGEDDEDDNEDDEDNNEDDHYVYDADGNEGGQDKAGDEVCGEGEDYDQYEWEEDEARDERSGDEVVDNEEEMEDDDEDDYDDEDNYHYEDEYLEVECAEGDGSLRMFAVAAILGNENLAACAVASFMKWGSDLSASSIGDLIKQVPVEYALAFLVVRDHCGEVPSLNDWHDLKSNFKLNLREIQEAATSTACSPQTGVKRKREE